MREMQRSTPMWHALVYNRNAFVGDIARFMGLEAPVSHWLMPRDYINGIRQASGGRTQLAGNWLASVNPAAARQQAQQAAHHETAPDARQQSVPEARQQTGSSSVASRPRRQQQAARPQQSSAPQSSYAHVQ